MDKWIGYQDDEIRRKCVELVHGTSTYGGTNKYYDPNSDVFYDVHEQWHIDDGCDIDVYEKGFKLVAVTGDELQGSRWYSQLDIIQRPRKGDKDSRVETEILELSITTTKAGEKSFRIKRNFYLADEENYADMLALRDALQTSKKFMV